MTASESLETIVTGRTESLFTADFNAQREELARCFEGRRVLVIGGAGSIGAATVRALFPLRPAALHVVDTSENNLAELVRDLRNTFIEWPVGDFATMPIDFGSPIMKRLITTSEPYNVVMNLAAIKHVRSEKDIYSLLQLVDTNIVKVGRLLRILGDQGTETRYFSVSTDKAANPTNLMGASKRAMEQVMFSGRIAPGPTVARTSARFANVAFSDGSILASVLKRMEKWQPVAAPKGARRYFITLREAAEICLLATAATPSHHLLIPRLTADNDLRDISEIVLAIVRASGYEPRVYEDARLAKEGLPVDRAAGRYPVLLTALDTDGEKPEEEFLAEGDEVIRSSFQNLAAVAPLPADEDQLATFMSSAENAVLDEGVGLDKEALIAYFTTMVGLRHVQTGKSLDDRL